MADLGWSKYIGQQERAAYEQCTAARRKHGLIQDPGDEVDCATCEARNDC